MAVKYTRVNFDIDLVRLGEAMRAWRLDAGLTQAESAECIGITQTWWSALERGLMAPSKAGEVPSMRVLISVINLILDDEPPSRVFEFFKLE